MERCTQFTSLLPPCAFLNSRSQPTPLAARQWRMETAGVSPAILLTWGAQPHVAGAQRHARVKGAGGE